MTRTTNMAEERIEVQDLWEVVAQRVRKQIAAGQLPPGSRLVESELATRYGVSRGPVREALRELARDGIIMLMPRRGAVVSSLTKKDLEEVYLVREALELLALREASRKATAKTLKGIRVQLEGIDKAIERGDWPEVVRADLDFHRAICHAAENLRLVTAWEQMASQTAILVGVAMTMDVSLVQGVGGHHEQVLEALIARNPELAGSILSENFRRVQDDLARQLDKHGSLKADKGRHRQ